jgi:hypothetical protein
MKQLDTQKIADVISPLSDKLEQLSGQVKLDNSKRAHRNWPDRYISGYEHDLIDIKLDIEIIQTRLSDLDKYEFSEVQHHLAGAVRGLKYKIEGLPEANP